MSESVLEDRLRRGLSGAAAELPDRELPPTPGGRSNHNHGYGRGHGRALVAGLVAAALIATVAVVTLRSDSGDDVSVTDDQPSDDGGAADDASRGPDGAQEPPPTSTSTTKPPDQVRATNGQIPGRAVVVDNEIRLYDADGNQTGTVSLAPLEDARSGASSDLNGGFVACGWDGKMRFGEGFDPQDLAGEDVPWLDVDPSEIESVDELNELIADLEPEDFLEGTIAPGAIDQLIWFPADGEPVVLDDNATCIGGLRVIDSQEGPMVLRGRMPGSDDTTASVQATVLATGETHELPVGVILDSTTGALGTTVTSERLLQPTADGLRLVDLATGDELPVADIDANPWAKYSLGPDGRSVAVADVPATGPNTIDVDGPVDVTVFDLETGEALYEGSFDMTIEGLSLSYDGTTLALGSGYEGSDPVTVVDLETGRRHSLGVHGRVL